MDFYFKQVCSRNNCTSVNVLYIVVMGITRSKSLPNHFAKRYHLENLHDLMFYPLCTRTRTHTPIVNLYLGLLKLVAGTIVIMRLRLWGQHFSGDSILSPPKSP